MTQVDDIANLPPAQGSRTEPDPGRTASPRDWLRVAIVALGTFTVVTSEMLPVGLLTPMSTDLRITEGVGGLTMTVTGLVAAVSAPLLTAWFARFDRRWVLCALLTVLALGNLAAALAPNFGVMIMARVLVGLGMGGVWALAAGLAVRLVPARSVGAATTMVFSGVAVASVLGIPAGTFLGALAGWRAAFATAAGVAVLVLIAVAVLLPALPAEQVVGLRGGLRRAADPRVRTGLLVVAFLVTDHFAAYTYIRPVLEEVSGASAGAVGTLLLGYGIAGVLGNFVAGSRAIKAPRATLIVISAVLALAALGLPAFGGTAVSTAALILVWGLAYGGVSVSTQSWMLLAAPDARDSVSALFVGVFNAAIALGALVGGQAADHLGITSPMWLGGALAFAAALTVILGAAPRAERAA
ncbi:MFS transporter [Nocardia crassostreae]|uniref:MFS transporter n=1 Tax=Nocardia crassostreae TaxID=53428 RepID=UPI00082DDB9C|nr:MFS transporter [Nocardia crassostreae]